MPIGVPFGARANGKVVRPLVRPPTIEYPCSDTQIHSPRSGTSVAAARVRHRNTDDIRGLELAILQNIDLRRKLQFLTRVEKWTPAAKFRLIRLFFERAVQPCRVVDLAADLRVTERTLQRRCRCLELPAPKKLFSVARALTVTRLLHWSRQPLSSVAFALGFSDDANCHRLLRRVLGSSQSREISGSEMDRVEEVITSELVACRSADNWLLPGQENLP